MSWAKKNVPLRIWLPLVVLLSLGMAWVHIMGNSRHGHGAMMRANTDSLSRFYHWAESLTQAHTPRRQLDLAADLSAVCGRIKADSTWRPAIRFADYYGANRRLEGWVARLYGGDRAGGSMRATVGIFVFDSVPDSVARLLPALRDQPVRFSGKFGFLGSDTLDACVPTMRINVLAIAPIAPAGHLAREPHASAH